MKTVDDINIFMHVIPRGGFQNCTTIFLAQYRRKYQDEIRCNFNSEGMFARAYEHHTFNSVLRSNKSVI